ncbi:MAG TPA: 6-bladed beta-propeller [Fodinibius sp.]|nr:6-bladed beta-propeller [Fodinibius sp.]
MDKFLIIAIIFILTACSSIKEEVPAHIKRIENLTVYSQDTEPESSVEFVDEITLEAPDSISRKWWGSNTQHQQWLAGIEIDDSGRIYVGDQRALGIHVFDIKGSYLTTLGRGGHGSGEYGGLLNPIQTVPDSLFVFDYKQFKLVKYSMDSLTMTGEKRVRTDPVNMDDYEKLAGWLSTTPLLLHDGRLLVGFYEHPPDARKGSPTYNLNQERPIRYYFMNQERNIISDEIFELNSTEDLVADVGGRHLFNLGPLPFLSHSLIAISDDDYIFTNWTKIFLIKVYGPSGNYLHAFYYPFQNKSLKRDEALSLFSKDDEWYWDLVQHADLPETWPAVHSMIADDKNRLWISTNIEKDGVYEWWVLHQDGELIARFQWPDDHSIETVKNGYAYVVKADEKTLVEQVKRYRIKME